MARDHQRNALGRKLAQSARPGADDRPASPRRTAEVDRPGRPREGPPGRRRDASGIAIRHHPPPAMSRWPAPLDSTSRPAAEDIRGHTRDGRRNRGRNDPDSRAASLAAARRRVSRAHRLRARHDPAHGRRAPGPVHLEVVRASPRSLPRNWLDRRRGTPSTQRTGSERTRATMRSSRGPDTPPPSSGYRTPMATGSGSSRSATSSATPQRASHAKCCTSYATARVASKPRTRSAGRTPSSCTRCATRPRASAAKPCSAASPTRPRC